MDIADAPEDVYELVGDFLEEPELLLAAAELVGQNILGLRLSAAGQARQGPVALWRV